MHRLFPSSPHPRGRGRLPAMVALTGLVACGSACTTEQNFEERLLDQQAQWAEACDDECPNDSVVKGTIVDADSFTTWACIDYFSWRDDLDAHCYSYDDAAGAECIKIFKRLNKNEVCDPEDPDMEALRDACLGAYERECLTEDLETG